MKTPVSRLTQPEIACARAAVERWRARLIDFSKRNPLLYFECTRSTRLRISMPTIDNLFEKLITQGKALTFPYPFSPGTECHTTFLQQELSGEPVEQTARIKEKPGDLFVDYTHSSARNVVELQRVLSRLAKRQREVREERGINTLHVAFGILVWREAPEEQGNHRAPLFLARASLAREGRTDPFQLKAEEENVILNPVLVAYFRKQWGINLSPPDATDSWRPSVYIQGLQRRVTDFGFEILDEAWLSHFWYEKLAMWEELGQENIPELLLQHPVLGPAVTGRPVEQTARLGSNFWEQFEKADTYPVLDADHSQLEILAFLGSGTSLVVEGPPGTGKSQTIANAIASAIGNGRTVLFVSQKRAALDVVLARLKEVGLDHLCLDLHGNDLDRGRVIGELVRLLDLALEEKRTEQKDDVSRLFDQRLRHRKALDAYVNELHRRRGRGGYTAYRVMGELSTMVAVPEVAVPDWSLSALQITRTEEAQFRENLRTIEQTGLWEEAPTHPWRGAVLCRPFGAFQDELDKQLTELERLLEEVLSVSRTLHETFGVELRVGSLAEVPIVTAALTLLCQPPERLEALWLTVSSKEALEVAEKGKRVAVLGREVERLQNLLTLRGFEPLIGLGSDAGMLLQRYRVDYASFLRWFRRSFWRDQSRLAKLTGRRPSYAVARSMLETCVLFQRLKDERNSLCSQIASFAPSPSCDAAAWEQVAEGLQWAARLSEVLKPGLSKQTAAALAALHGNGRLQSTAKELRNIIARLSTELARVIPFITDLFPGGLEGVALERCPLEKLLARCQLWRNNLTALPEWAAFQRAHDAAIKAGLGPFLEAARKAGVKSSDLERAFLKFLRRRWIEEVWKQEPVLAEFSGRQHELVRTEFAKLDRELHQLGARAVVRKAWEKQSAIRLAAEFHTPSDIASEIRLLRHEANKKRRRLPVRQLLPRLPNLLRLLTPCVMTSPLAVSSYLPFGVFRFDLVLVDEASQLRPEDAVGSVLRASQVAVFGDSKQMPPSQFFERLIDDDTSLDDQDEGAALSEDVTAFESVLDYFATVLPRRRLRWHYRSRDERLIAFSNNQFYADAPLITFPAPFRKSSAADTGVELIVVKDGLWEPGTRRNIREAQEVVTIVERLLREKSDRSLGVIALGLGQAETIEALLERRFQEEPDLEAAARQGSLFVKNLENVQGDERDEIVLSIGYAPTVPGGPVPLRFGPLNLEGGERRLNVAITRARFKTTVVCSFFPDSLLRGENIRPGVCKLFEYLSYCQRGGEYLTVNPEPGSDSCESPFEEAVRDALVRAGYEVRTQVGVSQFRIDLAVVDPDNRDRFILGIECDGATYHSSPSARERDRLRQEVLERLGWHICRIWSTDWLNNPDAELKRLTQKIEYLRKRRQPK